MKIYLILHFNSRVGSIYLPEQKKKKKKKKLNIKAKNESKRAEINCDESGGKIDAIFGFNRLFRFVSG